MDIELIGQEMKKVELELSKIEEEYDRLVEKLEGMREKITVYSYLKSRPQSAAKYLVIVPSPQPINNGLILHHIYEITSIKDLSSCVYYHIDTPAWEFSRKVLVLKFGEDNVCEAERRVEEYFDYLEEQKGK